MPPTPQDLHTYLTLNPRRTITITTPTTPFLPHYPLTHNQNMESRPCHHTGSRIHTLTCGHTISTLLNAQPCATNCSTPKTTLSNSDSEWLNSSIPAALAPRLISMRKTIEAALNVHKSFLEEQGYAPDVVMGYIGRMHLEVLYPLFEKVDAELCPRVDFMGGDFACGVCGWEGERRCWAGVVLDFWPYHCVVVAREGVGLEIVKAMVGGLRPEAPVGRGGGFGRGAMGGGRGRGRIGMTERAVVRNARMARQRVGRKNGRLEDRKEESAAEDMNLMDL